VQEFLSASNSIVDDWSFSLWSVWILIFRWDFSSTRSSILVSIF